MSVQIPKKPETLEDVHKTQLDFYDNISWSDLKIGSLETVAPTLQTLEVGRARLVEISGVPELYYVTTSGVLYKFTGVAV